MNPHLSKLKAYYAAEGIDEDIAPMEKYMRNKFKFYGLKSQRRKDATVAFLKENPLPKDIDLYQYARDCWAEPYRELHYFAMFLWEKKIKRAAPEDIEFLEYLITHNSWWDSVDFIAPHLVWRYFKQYPAQKESITTRWIESHNFWLQRSAIIFQLKAKKEIDAPLLYRYILRRSDSKEFFVQKAIGWALREHSKKFPSEVIAFIEQHKSTLKPLSIREGLKWVINH